MLLCHSRIPALDQTKALFDSSATDKMVRNLNILFAERMGSDSFVEAFDFERGDITSFETVIVNVLRNIDARWPEEDANLLSRFPVGDLAAKWELENLQDLGFPTLLVSSVFQLMDTVRVFSQVNRHKYVCVLCIHVCVCYTYICVWIYMYICIQYIKYDKYLANYLAYHSS